MDLNSATDPSLENVQTTKPAIVKDSFTGATASMFNNAQNMQFMGNSCNITTNTTNFNTVNRLDALHKRVAPNAILNAGGRPDEVRCHPGTREEVIGRIERWRDAKDGPTVPIFWLSGPAGAGKSAIMQTIAERCQAQGVPHANFFFFRADNSRSNAFPLVATLLHQIIELYPALRDPMAAELSANPLIFDSILENQLVQLLVTPLRSVKQSESSFRAPLLLIDGLDECDSETKNGQRQILRAFDKAFAGHPCLFRLLVASRDESQIRTAFNEMSSPCLSLYLDSDSSPESDIRIFVNAQFKHVRKTHPLAHTLEATWPSVEDVDGIVNKSSGQFIYAATVMRFISNSSASPTLSLQRVQGAARIATKSPFSHLDAIYTYILSQVDDQETLKDILHTQLLIHDSHSHMHFASLLQIHKPNCTESLVRSCLADLTAISQRLDNGRLVFHHASFSDYLLDKSRSEGYFVDIDAFNFEILPGVWKCVGMFPGVYKLTHYGTKRLRMLPHNLLSTLRALNPSELKFGLWDQPKELLQHIYSLCTCDEDVMSYKQITRGWINLLEDPEILRGSHGAEHPPCSRRYFTMARLQRNLALELSDEIATALRPETEFDTRETALWLYDLFHRIHGEYYSREIGIYRQLLKQWVLWAVWNNIPTNGLNNIPNIRWYLWTATMRKWAATYFQFGNGK